MPLIVSPNIISLNTRRKLKLSQSSPASSMHRLALGLRVHSPGNDTISTTPMAAQAAISNVAGTVNIVRAVLGASRSRLEAVISKLHLSIEHQSSASSRTIDTRLAVGSNNLGRTNTLQPAGSAMVAQADPLPQQVLQLLR